jgi:hypothetical protein
MEIRVFSGLTMKILIVFLLTENLSFSFLSCTGKAKPKLLGFISIVNNNSSTATTVTSTPTTTPTTTTSATPTTTTSTVTQTTPSITYSGSPYSFTSTVSITTITPTVSGTITSCSSSPPLPSGLTLSAACEITGTPTTVTAAANYTITPSMTNGTATTTISISVLVRKYKIFVTTATYTGDLKTLGSAANGPLGADNLCNADSNKPSSGTYKAMINDGANRNACNTNSDCTNPIENVNWIMTANTDYVRASDTASLFTTNTAGINTNWPLPNSFDAGAAIQYWTGFSNGTIWGHSTTDCNLWTSSSNADTGRIGQSNSLSYNDAIRDAVISPTCDLPQHLLCVEQ